MILLLLLLGSSFAIDSACLEKEFLINGYSTGQNIDLNVASTRVHTASGATALTVAFFVPQVFYEQHEAAAYSITFNRNKDITTPSSGSALEQKTGMVVEGTGTGADTACFTNRYHEANNATAALCDQGANPTYWSDDGVNAENACIEDVSVTVPWADVTTNNFFGARDVKDNGEFTEVFLLATVETWSHFTQTTGTDYLGQMTGNEQHSGVGGEKDRTGEYVGDGGDKDVHFDALHMDDERYTLYQIPFILRFPKTVVVEQSFTIGTQATMLHGIVSQNTIQVNLNPDHTNEDVTFAALEVTVSTSIQYPYALRSPEDSSDAKMTVEIGGSADGGGTHAASITILDYDDKESCRDLHDGDMCRQDWKMRIIPADDRPCRVDGDYTIETWADCLGGFDAGGDGRPDACALDELNTDSDKATRRGKNGHFVITFNVQHQEFCPQVMDTVKVVSDIKAYHDEAFEQQVTSSDVYTNDILFYEATYRTATDESGDADADFLNNNDGAGGDSTIDYVRAVKITLTVTIGEDMDGNDDANTWNASWKENVNWGLGGSRLANDDFTDDPALTLTNDPDNGGDANHIQYEINLCEHDDINAHEIQDTTDKPADCFAEPYGDGDERRGSISREYLDFNKVNVGGHASGSGNTIDENEIAFKLRLDERIVPVGPYTDDSHVGVKVEAEVYYKGNRHPTRRLLQVDDSFNMRSQRSIATHSVPIHYKAAALKTCMVNESAPSATINLVLDFGKNRMPQRGRDAVTWATDFSMQLDAHLGVRHAVKVVHLQDAHSVLYSADKFQRRAEISDGRMAVKLEISSTDHSKAGIIANELQQGFSKGRIPLINAFQNSIVVDMDVPTCLEKVEYSAKLASSATVSSTLFALVVAFVSLL